MTVIFGITVVRHLLTKLQTNILLTLILADSCVGVVVEATPDWSVRGEDGRPFRILAASSLHDVISGILVTSWRRNGCVHCRRRQRHDGIVMVVVVAVALVVVVVVVVVVVAVVAVVVVVEAAAAAVVVVMAVTVVVVIAMTVVVVLAVTVVVTAGIDCRDHSSVRLPGVLQTNV